MTINIGLKYDKGVILLADGRMGGGLKIESENYFKIVKICNNVSTTIAGTTINSRYLENLAVSAATCEKYFCEFGEVLNEKDSKKAELFLKRADIRITSDMGPEDSPENMTLEKVLTNLNGEEMFAANIFRVHKYNDQILFNVKSAAEQFCNFTDEDVGGIVGGMDFKGPRIFEIGEEKSCIEQNKWSVIGAGFTLAGTYLKDHYEKNFSFENALELAIFCGIRVAQDYSVVNTNFNAVNIYKEKEKIVNELVPKKMIKKITNAYLGKKGTFEPLSE